MATSTEQLVIYFRDNFPNLKQKIVNGIVTRHQFLIKLLGESDQNNYLELGNYSIGNSSSTRFKRKIFENCKVVQVEQAWYHLPDNAVVPITQDYYDSYCPITPKRILMLAGRFPPFVDCTKVTHLELACPYSSVMNILSSVVNTLTHLSISPNLLNYLNSNNLILKLPNLLVLMIELVGDEPNYDSINTIIDTPKLIELHVYHHNFRNTMINTSYFPNLRVLHVRVDNYVTIVNQLELLVLTDGQYVQEKKLREPFDLEPRVNNKSRVTVLYDVTNNNFTKYKQQLII